MIHPDPKHSTTLVECNLCGKVYPIVIGYQMNRHALPDGSECAGYFKPYIEPRAVTAEKLDRQIREHTTDYDALSDE